MLGLGFEGGPGEDRVFEGLSSIKHRKLFGHSLSTGPESFHFDVWNCTRSISVSNNQTHQKRIKFAVLLCPLMTFVFPWLVLVCSCGPFQKSLLSDHAMVMAGAARMMPPAIPAARPSLESLKR